LTSRSRYDQIYCPRIEANDGFEGSLYFVYLFAHTPLFVFLVVFLFIFFGV
jgi:hypothetical protein